MKKLIILSFFLVSYCMTQAQETCNNFWARVSPDGNFIYFSSDRHGGDYEIYKVDIEAHRTSGNSRIQALTNFIRRSVPMAH
ncbi:MAG: hypothetical protein K0B08_06795 [Bacteroidales bacterium]|nr:hypothetical protein [Bacteroidales bacterium]